MCCLVDREDEQFNPPLKVVQQCIDGQCSLFFSGFGVASWSFFFSVLHFPVYIFSDKSAYKVAVDSAARESTSGLSSTSNAEGENSSFD